MKFLSACIIALLLSGCLSQPDCPGATTNQVQIAFKNALTGKAQKVSFSSIVTSNNPNQVHPDSVSSVALPVDPFSKETTFRMTYGAKLSATNSTTGIGIITVNYNVQNIIVSVDCGPYLFCSDLGITSSTFPNEIKLLSNKLTTSETVNIEVRL